MRGKVLVVAAALLVTGCAAMAKVVKYERGGSFDMPDLKGLTVAQAKDKLATSGITGGVSIVDNYVCHDESVPVGYVCSTHPVAGASRTARTPTTLYTRPAPTQAPMPDVVGMTPPKAREVLQAGGFERVEVEELRPDQVPEGCKGGTVCRTSPPAGQDHGFRVITVLYAAPKGYKPPVKPEPKPDEPKPDEPKPDEPKPEPKPEPIF
jgi:beta-lactam-binding protein with PASTA domain